MGLIFWNDACRDYNECTENKNICVGATTCVNTLGSYYCQCSLGFVYDNEINDGRTCKNLNECKVNADKCSEHQKCIDTMGTYECVCDAGYMSDGLSGCRDSNECLMNSHSCDENAECTDKVFKWYFNLVLPNHSFETTFEPSKDNDGSYQCTCTNGFQGDGFECVDIEECFDELHDCGDGDGKTTCINTFGSYYCECNRGWIMVGFA